MIVVDTNLIAYFFLHGEYSDLAEKAFRKDSQWAAPLLWRSEFRSVVVKCIRDGFIAFDDAVQVVGEAEVLMKAAEYAVESFDILRLAASANCSAYDAEFVVLARELGIPLVTMDTLILKTFPETAIRLDRFISG